MLKTNRNTYIYILISLSILFSVTAKADYFSEDKKYTDTILANSVWGNDWTVKPSKRIPPKLVEYAATESKIFKGKDGTKKSGLLYPRTLIKFKKSGDFLFVWQKNNKKAGEIAGKWNVENSNLIFTLIKNYTKPYMLNTELRYKILKTTNNNFHLKLEGIEHPPVTKIIKTSNNPIYDMEKIAAALKQAKVEKHKKNKN
ncbi:MAG: hypothetical protein GY756_08860 [bacterium]|nr:hypothetical protein [bacterium]